MTENLTRPVTPEEIADAVPIIGAALAPLAEQTDEPHPYMQVAEALEDLAERCRQLALAPEAADLAKPTVISIYLNPAGTMLSLPGNADTVATVAAALLPDVAVGVKGSGSLVEAIADGAIGPVSLQVAASVPAPPDPRDAELEQLRAEAAALRAQVEGRSQR